MNFELMFITSHYMSSDNFTFPKKHNFSYLVTQITDILASRGWWEEYDPHFTHETMLYILKYFACAIAVR